MERFTAYCNQACAWLDDLESFFLLKVIEQPCWFQVSKCLRCITLARKVRLPLPDGFQDFEEDEMWFRMQ